MVIIIIIIIWLVKRQYVLKRLQWRWKDFSGAEKTSVALVYIGQARMSDEMEDYILVAPSGLTCDEVTASSLVKLSPVGDIIDAGSTGLSVDSMSLALHSALYASPRRSDIKGIMHITSTTAISVRMLMSYIHNVNVYHLIHFKFVFCTLVVWLLFRSLLSCRSWIIQFYIPQFFG